MNSILSFKTDSHLIVKDIKANTSACFASADPDVNTEDTYITVCFLHQKWYKNEISKNQNLLGFSISMIDWSFCFSWRCLRWRNTHPKRGISNKVWL